MKKIYTLTLGFLMLILSGIFLIFMIFLLQEKVPDVNFLAVGLISIFSILNIIFFIKVKFWEIEDEEYSTLNEESLILKKKIEQKELKIKLLNLEKDDEK